MEIHHGDIDCLVLSEEIISQYFRSAGMNWANGPIRGCRAPKRRALQREGQAALECIGKTIRIALEAASASQAAAYLSFVGFLRLPVLF